MDIHADEPKESSVTNFSKVALDIGGTLAKIVYLVSPDEEEHDTLGTSTDETLQIRTIDGNIFKMKVLIFPTAKIDSLIKFVSDEKLVSEGVKLPVTGGGSYKFADHIQNRLKVVIEKYDEMESLVKGLNFLASLSDMVFDFDVREKRTQKKKLQRPLHPFMVVNIGSGVSILRCNGPDNFVRVTGTCIGGGTVLGLSRLLFGATSFDEVIRLSEAGTVSLDLTVEDLFGAAAQSFDDRHFSGETLASSFGRVYSKQSDLPAKQLIRTFRREDIARSLVYMVSYNIGYIAYLVATIHGVSRIFFTGRYTHNHPFTWESITQGVQFYITHYHQESSKESENNRPAGDSTTRVSKPPTRHRRYSLPNVAVLSSPYTIMGDQARCSNTNSLPVSSPQARCSNTNSLPVSSPQAPPPGVILPDTPCVSQTPPRLIREKDKIEEENNNNTKNKDNFKKVITKTERGATASTDTPVGLTTPVSYEVLFIKLEGFIGALGALLSASPIDQSSIYKISSNH
eukprot:GHVL01024306.1.p1 GENE.GHVL01024306.1~~GHVL01024306.1.p1  ORF type:complete len:513 (-),score=60.34 GHVL01024306.1:795-2333(-)